MRRGGRRRAGRLRAAAAPVRAGDRWSGAGPPPAHHLPGPRELPRGHAPRVPPAVALPNFCALVSVT